MLIFSVIFMLCFSVIEFSSGFPHEPESAFPVYLHVSLDETTFDSSFVTMQGRLDYWFRRISQKSVTP